MTWTMKTPGWRAGRRRVLGRIHDTPEVPDAQDEREFAAFVSGRASAFVEIAALEELPEDTRNAALRLLEITGRAL